MYLLPVDLSCVVSFSPWISSSAASVISLLVSNSMTGTHNSNLDLDICLLTVTGQVQETTNDCGCTVPFQPFVETLCLKSS